MINHFNRVLTAVLTRSWFVLQTSISKQQKTISIYNKHQSQLSLTFLRGR